MKGSMNPWQSESKREKRPRHTGLHHNEQHRRKGARPVSSEQEQIAHSRRPISPSGESSLNRWFTSDIFKEIFAKAAASNGCATGRQWGRASFCSCARTSAGAGVVSSVSIKGGLEDARRCAPSEEMSLRRVAPRHVFWRERTKSTCQTAG